MTAIRYFNGALGDPSILMALESHETNVMKLVNGTYNPRDLEMLNGHPKILSYRLNKVERLLLTIYREKKNNLWYLIVLELLPTHDYAKSRFLKPGVLKKFLENNEQDLLKSISDAEEIPDMLKLVNDTHLRQVNTRAANFRGVYLHNDSIVALSSEQEKAIASCLPSIIIGQPGSGKTIVTTIITAEQKALELVVGKEAPPQKLLYLSQSWLLAHEQQKNWEAAHPDNPIEFATYNQIMLQENDADDVVIVDASYFYAWYSQYKRTPRLQDTKKRTAPSLWVSPEHAYEECRICTGCDTLDDYKALGNRQSTIPKDKRAVFYALYEAYKRELGHKQIDPAINFLPLPIEKYDLVIVDEAQDFSPGQLRGLALLAKKGAIVFCMDPHQKLYDRLSTRTFLSQLLQKTWGRVEHVVLPLSHRCPEKIASVANHLVEAKYRLTGGKSDTFESSSIVSSATHNGMGNVFVIDKHQLIAWEWLQKQAAQGLGFAVITSEQFYKEACSLFPSYCVFLPEESKGLEFLTVLLYRPFSSEKMKVAVRTLQSTTIIAGRRPQNRAKKGSGDPVHATELNRWITATTRAEETLVLFQEADSRNSLLQLIKSDELSTIGDVQEATPSDWQALIMRYVNAGQHERAYQLYGAVVNKDGTATQFEAFITKRNSPSITTNIVCASNAQPAPTPSHSPILLPPSRKPTRKSKADTRAQKINPGVAGYKPTTKELQLIRLALYPKTYNAEFLEGVLIKILENTENFIGCWLHPYSDADNKKTQSLTSYFRNGKKYPQLIKALANSSLIALQKIELNVLCNHISLKHKKSVMKLSAIITNIIGEHFIAENFDMKNSLKNLVILNAFSNFKTEPLAQLVELGVLNPILFKTFLRLIGNLDAPNKGGNTLVFEAVERSDTELLKLLHKFGANFYSYNAGGFTPATVATNNEDIRVLKTLAELGIDLNKQDMNEFTPAIYAAQSESLELFKTLLVLEVDLLKSNNHGVTPAYMAVACNNTLFLKRLYESGVDFNTLTIKGLPILFFATINGSLPVLKLLSRLNVKLDERLHDGSTAFSIAAYRGNISILKIFATWGLGEQYHNDEDETTHGYATTKEETNDLSEPLSPTLTSSQSIFFGKNTRPAERTQSLKSGVPSL